MGPNNESATVDCVCREVYAAAKARYEALSGQMGDRAFGYKILYGPPTIAAPILFVGAQPGGVLSDAIDGEALGERLGWPERCEYAIRPWTLSARMQTIWQREFLEHCTGFNANFFRARNDAEWRRLPRDFRFEASGFCLEQAEKLARVLRPRQIVVIGLGTLRRVARRNTALTGSRGGVLIQSGELWGHPAHWIIHLSGARISTVDLEKMKSFLTHSST
jgi:hypothetical protein